MIRTKVIIILLLLNPELILYVAVGGCHSREPDDPGNLQFDWLEVQLKTYRSRGLKVWRYRESLIL